MSDIKKYVDSPERRKAKKEHEKETYDSKRLLFKKGHLAIVDEIAKVDGKPSTNAFIMEAISEKVARMIMSGQKIPSLPDNFLPQPNNVPKHKKSGEG